MAAGAGSLLFSGGGGGWALGAVVAAAAAARGVGQGIGGGERGELLIGEAGELGLGFSQFAVDLSR